ncbi:hypothetical protein ABT010_29085 [Streptomyces sp. NPDC002668]|uniref:hypothetical protein n=1 Tax=Streptomyces sp. NPDC002668 TaxID=3154422 RepID=UPI003327DD95
MIWRQDAGFDRIAKVVRGVADGRGVLPASVQGWLINHIGTVHGDVLGPMGLTPSGLEAREVEVLQLLVSAGLSPIQGVGATARELSRRSDLYPATPVVPQIGWRRPVRPQSRVG